MSKKIAGTLSIDINGAIVSAGASCSLMTQTEVYESKVGLSGRGGFTAKPIAPYVEIELLTDDTEVEEAVAALNGEDSDTVQLDLANGESWIWTSCWSTGERARDAAEGNFTARVECLPDDLIKNF